MTQEEAIKYLKQWNPINPAKKEAVEMAIDSLGQPQWISIEDAEKPRTLQMVWIAHRLHDGKIRVTLAKYRDYGKSHWLYPWNSVFWEDVIAWMPLKVPEPPMLD